ncbi:16410_t:CDS:1, partial [Funneliformis caledonium]
TFPKVCELYELSDDLNPNIDVYPIFHCGSANLSSEKSETVIKHLIAELKLCQDITPLDKAYEATKTIYSYCYLVSEVSFYKDNFKLIPEKLIESRNRQENLDYAVECRSTGRILGVIEVKKEDFMKGFAQMSVQMESTCHVNARQMKSITDRM